MYGGMGCGFFHLGLITPFIFRDLIDNALRRRALLSRQFFHRFKVLPLVMPLVENLLLSRKIHTSFLESGNLETDETVQCCRTQNIS